ncbi:MAG TPA: tRNA (adenosine(37)-N6)-threonylcarbamoyltransferase complex ATPase subunit type 1 TsaE [Pirellulales bacterium]|jgi:tRNA threonylcarbamoyladenosine biosynthesis protein TsaE|nr:tRNA (adenosine(37)-N6)-threonylcarbamoyltransferase complex ATPase subunit type 1 TsaE [Pirellulales bacterium]
MSDRVLQFELVDEAGTAALGRTLAATLPTQAVVGLVGPLGAGKTRLVQAVAEASGINRRDVTSPTFVLVQEYHGRRTIYHADAYRVADDDEFWQLGLDERFDQPALVFVEWADRVARCLPRDRFDIQLTPLAGDQRQVNVFSYTDRFGTVLRHLRDQFIS